MSGFTTPGRDHRPNGKKARTAATVGNIAGFSSKAARRQVDPWCCLQAHKKVMGKAYRSLTPEWAKPFGKQLCQHRRRCSPHPSPTFRLKPSTGNLRQVVHISRHNRGGLRCTVTQGGRLTARPSPAGLCGYTALARLRRQRAQKPRSRERHVHESMRLGHGRGHAGILLCFEKIRV